MTSHAVNFSIANLCTVSFLFMLRVTGNQIQCLNEGYVPIQSTAPF